MICKCKICGENFERRNNAKTCSDGCSKELTRRRNASYETTIPRVLSEETRRKDNERAKKYYRDHKDEILKARKDKKGNEKGK